MQIATQDKGLHLIPLNFHLSRGRIKVSLGLCRSKNQADKRDSLKRKQNAREDARLTKMRF
jgi:SsrA-binding protein